MNKNSKIYDELGDRIRILRLAKRLKQRELGEMVGKNHQYIYRIERNLSVPDTITTSKLCEIFGITVDDLFSPELRIPRPIQGNNEINSMRGSVE